MKKFCALSALVALIFAFPACATEEKDDFLRGIWVSSVLNLDFPSKPGLEAGELRAEADEIVSLCVETGMNAIFLQVRPCADALYKSAIFPVSAYLGKNCGDFDPLAYFIQKAHANGIELHAWINPYRVTRMGEEDYLALDPSNPAAVHPEYLLKAADGNYFFDPALPEVRDLICAGVEEIIRNYDVDGIHFDDYFYPDAEFDDSASFEVYGSGDVENWRVENVNALIKAVSDTVRSINPDISFGISPRGIWANDYDNVRGSATRGNGSLTSIYCDSLRFIDEGWVDYICPQIYWYIGYPAADYRILVPWWAEAVRGSGVKLYIGMADYRSAEAKEAGPWLGTDELRRQLELNSSYSLVSGEVHFRYGSIASQTELRKMYADIYNSGSMKATATERVKENLIMLIKRIITGR